MRSAGSCCNAMNLRIFSSLQAQLKHFLQSVAAASGRGHTCRKEIFLQICCKNTVHGAPLQYLGVHHVTDAVLRLDDVMLHFRDKREVLDKAGLFYSHLALFLNLDKLQNGGMNMNLDRLAVNIAQASSCRPSQYQLAKKICFLPELLSSSVPLL